MLTALLNHLPCLPLALTQGLVTFFLCAASHFLETH